VVVVAEEDVVVEDIVVEDIVVEDIVVEVVVVVVIHLELAIFLLLKQVQLMEDVKQ
jgi:hypothetical protein